MHQILPASFVILFATSALLADDSATFPKPAPSSGREPLAKTLSLEKAGSYLDGAVMAWTREQHCASCHTTYSYLMGRAAAGDSRAPALLQMRAFLENRVTNWDSRIKADALPDGSEGVTEVVATAATLAFDDARTSGKLHPLTRQALDRLWATQNDEGAWDWNKHDLPPLEYDEYYGAVFAAMGVGFAPEAYAQSEGARPGLVKLRRYFAENPPPNLHHKAWLLFASLRLEGLMTKAQRDKTIGELLSLQRDDGGWNLPSLGPWNRLDGSPNAVNGPSDGYATGLIVYLLRQTGMTARERPIERGVAWLKTNQRESGRWFTRSLNADRNHYLTNAGTAFALLALEGIE
jgi:squalene-hopene/tetraprenyl-beta-curcumene cyclase